MNKKILFKPKSKYLDAEYFEKKDILKIGVKKENEKGLYVLCSKKDKECIFKVKAIYKEPFYYVDSPKKIDWYYLFFKIDGKFEKI